MKSQLPHAFPFFFFFQAHPGSSSARAIPPPAPKIERVVWLLLLAMAVLCVVLAALLLRLSHEVRAAYAASGPLAYDGAQWLELHPDTEFARGKPPPPVYDARDANHLFVAMAAFRDGRRWCVLAHVSRRLSSDGRCVLRSIVSTVACLLLSSLVQPCAYRRDGGSGETIFKLFDKAARPARVHIGVVDQRAADDVACVAHFCELERARGDAACSRVRPRRRCGSHRGRLTRVTAGASA